MVRRIHLNAINPIISECNGNDMNTLSVERSPKLKNSILFPFSYVYAENSEVERKKCSSADVHEE